MYSWLSDPISRVQGHLHLGHDRSTGLVPECPEHSEFVIAHSCCECINDVVGILCQRRDCNLFL